MYGACFFGGGSRGTARTPSAHRPGRVDARRSSSGAGWNDVRRGSDVGERRAGDSDATKSTAGPKIEIRGEIRSESGKAVRALTFHGKPAPVHQRGGANVQPQQLSHPEARSLPSRARGARPLCGHQQARCAIGVCQSTREMFQAASRWVIRDLTPVENL